MLQGTTTIPSVKNDPEEIGAVWSSHEWTTSAKPATSRADNPVSRWMVARAHRDSTKCVCTSGHCCSSQSSLTPITAPVAPVMPTMIRLIQLTPSSWKRSVNRRSPVPRGRRRWNWPSVVEGQRFFAAGLFKRGDVLESTDRQAQVEFSQEGPQVVSEALGAAVGQGVGVGPADP